MSTAAPSADRPLFTELGDALAPQLANLVRWWLGLFDRHIGSKRTVRFFALTLLYALIVGAAFNLAYELRWDFVVPNEFNLQAGILIIPVVLCKLLLLHSFGQYRSILSYFSLADFGGVVFAMCTVSGLMIGLWVASDVSAAPPRGVIMMDFILSVSALSAFRLSLRVARSMCQGGVRPRAVSERRVAIIGAGDIGEAVAKDLLQKRGSGLYPVLFIDDDPARIGRTVHGLPVYGPLAELPMLARRGRINELVITLADASPKRVREIVELGRQVGASTQIIPSVTQLASGQVKVERSRPVAIEDLLGRAPVNLDSGGIARLIEDKVVLVTGAGGSIGSELCRQILAQGPRRLLLVERSEFALFEIEQELLKHSAGRSVLAVVADIADEAAIRPLLEQHRPAIIFHAAAHKHVPLMEQQPAEAVRNNTLATAALTRLAAEHAVERFVFISTDKAINPTSVMGCTKRLAEKSLQARQHAPGNATAFMAVRFGNVLGSSGSVIPTFRRQIAQGGPVTVTHRDMTRYFMTIPEAVGLVLQAATLGQGGEIFILDMSEPIKIYDMARQMIELSGYRPGEDIEIQVTGLRPGEKLYEELRHTDESHEPTEHPRIFKLRNDTVPPDPEAWLGKLRAAADHAEAPEIKQVMKELVPEYTPYVN